MQTENSRDYAGIAFAVGFCVLGVWGIAETRGMSDLGAVFPRTIGIAMVLFSIVFIVLGVLKPARAGEEREQGSALRRIGLVVVSLIWILSIWAMSKNSME